MQNQFFLLKTKANYIVLFLIGQDLQEDILTAICDHRDTWTCLWSVLTIQVGV